MVHLDVMSWNVLAAVHTHHNKGPPKCTQGHQGHLEELHENGAQTRARYTMASTAIMQSDADVVLLQEVDVFFMQKTHNPLIDAVRDAYSIAVHTIGGLSPSGSRSQSTTGMHAGTAVLVRKNDETLKILPGSAFRVVAPRSNNDRYGGISKSACGVLVLREAPTGPSDAAVRPVAVVSLHAAGYTPNKAKAMFKDITHQLLHTLHRLRLTGRTTSVVIGGDFNATLDAMRSWRNNASVLNVMNPVSFGNKPTSMNADFSGAVAIDHIFASKGAKLAGKRARLEGAPRSPYAPTRLGVPATVQDASDHVRIAVTFSLPLPPLDQRPLPVSTGGKRNRASSAMRAQGGKAKRPNM